MPNAFLAVDWGTTNCRAWRIGPEGRVEARREFPLGVAKLQLGEAEARFQSEVRPALDALELPALLCGMIGSNLGWTAVPYLEAPADLRALAGALHPVAAKGPPVAIVPGVRCRRLDGTPDVMRGEETPTLGWIAMAPERREGDWLVHHPGTHAKWMLLRDGRLERFVTAMTGELFDLLSRHGVLRSNPEDPDDEAAFRLGLQAAGDGAALAARLFTTRSRVVGGDLPPVQARSYLSGLLIGAEVAATPGLLGAPDGAAVAILGDDKLCLLYHRAMAARGVSASVHDGDQATLAGLTAIMKEARP
jgi:2-dehydro-3-deoxygalactonokinase